MNQLPKDPHDIQTSDSLTVDERHHQEFFARRAAEQAAMRRLKVWHIAQRTAQEIANNEKENP